jgi:hypothetical protein
MSKRASDDALSALHQALAVQFKDILENGKTVEDRESGELVRVTPDASTLNAIRQFLKDNNIQSAPGTNKELEEMSRRVDLPFPTKTDDYGPTH